LSLKVLGMGDNVADHYVHTGTIYPGGCAYNFAMFATMLGAESAYLGVIGDDLAGTHVLRTARGEGIDTSRCRVYHGEAPRPAVRIEDGDRIFVGGNAGGVWERPFPLDEQDLAYVRGFQLVHTSIFSAIEEHLPALAGTGVPVSMDFSDEFSEVFFQAHCPQVTYAILSCRHLSEEQTRERIATVHALGSPYVVATRAELGSFFSDGLDVYHHPAHMVTARDAMGAGDSFLTAFLLRYVAWQHTAGIPPSAAERRTAAESALAAAAEFAAQVCLIDGSSGHGAPYPERG
jgi:fructoselysine 6-kinase